MKSALQNMQTLSGYRDALRPDIHTEKYHEPLPEEYQSILETSEDQPKLHATIKFNIFKIPVKTKN